MNPRSIVHSGIAALAAWVFFLFAFSLTPAAAAASEAVGAQPALKVGIFPRRNATQTATLFKPLLDHLAAALGREVQLITAKDFPTFWEGVAERRFDLVHYNQYHYVKSHALYGYDAVLSNEEFGEALIAGALYVRKDGAPKLVQDLKGKTIIFGGDRSAMMSYIVPTDLLRYGGLSPADYTEKFAVSPPNSVFAVYFKQADAAGAGEVVRKLPSVTKRIDPEQLELLAVSEPIPHLPWAVRSGMDPVLRDRITLVLSGLKDTETGRSLLKNAKLTGLHPIADADYDLPRQIIARVLGEQY